MNYTHAGMKQPGEVGSTGSNESMPPNAHVPGSVNPRAQPTDGASTGVPVLDNAIGMVRAAAMGNTKPSGIAGSSAPGLAYTHAGTRQPGEVQS